MYQKINKLAQIAGEIRLRYSIFTAQTSDVDVCVKFARRLHDSCLPTEDILMLARLSDDWIDFRTQLEDWACPTQVTEK